MTRDKKTPLSQPLKSLRRALLAGTCLSAATLAQASTFAESTDFSNTLAGAVSAPLPIGTNIVTGSFPGNDPADYFDFIGLAGGSSYSFTFMNLDGGSQQFFTVSTSGGMTLNAQFVVYNPNPVTVTGTIPANGQLVVGGQQAEGFGAHYQVDLTAPTAAPEPATGAIVGLGLAAAGVAAARRRKLSK